MYKNIFEKLFTLIAEAQFSAPWSEFFLYTLSATRKIEV